MTHLPLFLTAGLSMPEKLSLSGEMVLRGMGTVFLVLIILLGIIALFGVVFPTGEKTAKKESAKPVQKAEPKKAEPKPAPAEKAPEAAPAVSTQDDSVIAAIIAAIEAYRAEEGLSGLPYRVVSFKRKSGKKSWSGNFED